MTPDETAIERMARAAYAKRVELQDARLGPYSAPCWDALPHTQRSDWIASQGAALAALIADPPPAVKRAVLEQLIARADNQEWGGTVRADLWLRRELAELAREERNAPDVI